MSPRFTLPKRVISLLALGAFAFTTTNANGDEYSYSASREYDAYVMAVARAYYVDPVNRRSSLTPEPVWRSMFPSIHERMMNEQRAFGTGGQVAREYRYWRRVR